MSNVRRFSSMPARNSSGSCAAATPGVVAARSHLADQGDVGGIGMKRLPNQLVGDVRTVILRGVDVVDTQLNCTSQHSDRLVVVTRRPEHPRPG